VPQIILRFLAVSTLLNTLVVSCPWDVVLHYEIWRNRSLQTVHTGRDKK